MRPVIRFLAWLPAQLPGATAVLARENASAGLRRTATLAAPVIVTVAPAASLMGTTATLDEARSTEARTQVTSDFVVTAAGEGAALPARFVERVRHIPGVVVSASRSTSVTVLEEGTALVGSEARAVDPADVAAVSALPVVAGSLAGLDDGSLVVNEEWMTTTIGEGVGVWLADGRRVTLRVAAVLSTGTGNNGVYVTPRNAGGAAVDRIDVKVGEGAGRSAVETQLEAAGRATGAQVETRAEWTAANRRQSGGNTRTGLLMILLIALVYTGIALANTQVMATSDRVRDLAVLRLAGATKAQVLRLVAAEAVLVVAVGAVLGGAVAALNLLGVRTALGLLDVHSALVVPWGTIGGRRGERTPGRGLRGAARLARAAHPAGRTRGDEGVARGAGRTGSAGECDDQVRRLADQAEFGRGQRRVGGPAGRRGGERGGRDAAVRQQVRHQGGEQCAYPVRRREAGIDGQLRQDQRRHGPVQGRRALLGVAPVDHHRAVGRQHHVVRMQVEVEDPVLGVRREPGRDGVQLGEQPGEYGGALGAVDVAAEQGLRHRRTGQPLQDQIAGAGRRGLRAEPGDRVARGREVGHDGQFAGGVQPVAVAAQDPQLVQFVYVGGAPAAQPLAYSHERNLLARAVRGESDRRCFTVSPPVMAAP